MRGSDNRAPSARGRGPALPRLARAYPRAGVATVVAALALLGCQNALAVGHARAVESQTGTAKASLEGLACPSATQCSAVDFYGGVVTFNPHAAHVADPITVDHDGPAALNAYFISCPTTTQCTVFDEDGGEATFNPRRPGKTRRVVVDKRSTPQAGVCLTASECVLVDNLGRVVTFSPSSPAHPRRVLLDSALGAQLTVSCPSTSQCSTITEFENALTFNPLTPALATPNPIDHPTPESAIALIGLSCPSVSECVATDVHGRELTFNPHAVGSPPPVAVTSGDPIYALNCISTTSCLATSEGALVTFDPTTPGHVASTKLATSRPGLGQIACPSATQCSVIARPTRELTFDPNAPSPARSAIVSSGRHPREH
jgi:hypothetical protein